MYVLIGNNRLTKGYLHVLLYFIQVYHSYVSCNQLFSTENYLNMFRKSLVVRPQAAHMQDERK